MAHDAYDPCTEVLTFAGWRLTWWGYADLSAPYWRLYWNGSVGAAVTLDDRVTPLGPGRLVLIPPNTPFAATLSRPVDHLFIHFMTGPAYRASRPGIFESPAGPETRARARALFRLVPPNGSGGRRARLLCSALIHQALAELPDDALAGRLPDIRIDAAMRRLERDVMDPPCNAALAADAAMSENAFIRLFRRHAGVSPQAYSLTQRIEQAGRLLHHSPLGIKEIADLTGFCDRYHFSRAFRRCRGTSPAAFRKAGHLSVERR